MFLTGSGFSPSILWVALFCTNLPYRAFPQLATRKNCVKYFKRGHSMDLHKGILIEKVYFSIAFPMISNRILSSCYYGTWNSGYPRLDWWPIQIMMWDALTIILGSAGYRFNKQRNLKPPPLLLLSVKTGTIVQAQSRTCTFNWLLVGESGIWFLKEIWIRTLLDYTFLFWFLCCSPTAAMFAAVQTHQCIPAYSLLCCGSMVGTGNVLSDIVERSCLCVRHTSYSTPKTPACLPLCSCS